MKRALANVSRATVRKHKAADDYLAAILEARQEGATFEQIAQAAGTYKANIHRIVRRRTGR